MFPVSSVKPKKLPPFAAAWLVVEMGMGWNECPAETLPCNVRFEKMISQRAFRV